MKGVQLTKLVQELGLHNLTPEIDLSEICDEDSGDQQTGIAAYRISGAFCK